MSNQVKNYVLSLRPREVAAYHVLKKELFDEPHLSLNQFFGQLLIRLAREDDEVWAKVVARHKQFDDGEQDDE